MAPMQHVPTIAIVGRPNVGKSAIFNRMAGRRIAIVHDEPGVTRDRISAPCKITDRACKLMDTGGIGARLGDGFADQVAAEADIAMKTADLILFVLDCRDHLTPIDQNIADHLRKSDVPVILLLNKADHEKQDLNLGEFSGLGFNDHIFLSAAHGRGFSELASRLDDFLEKAGAPLKEEMEEEPEDGEETAPPIKVAVVGRPNAGKSSLLSLVSGSEGMAKDMLFATLDTTTRKIELPHGQPLLLTDTVGFIRNLPHRLVEAFKSTLEEAVLADFLVQVVDASDPEAVRHYETTLEVLSELGAGDKPMIVVLNKVDLVPEEKRHTLEALLKPHFNGRVVPMSVQEEQGAEDLLDACVEMLESRVRRASFLIPYTRSDLVAAMHSEGKVLSTEYVEEGTLLEAVLPVAFYNKLSSFRAEK